MAEMAQVADPKASVPQFRLCAAGFVAEDKSFFQDMASSMKAVHHVSPIRGFFDDPEVRFQEKPVVLVLNASHVDFNLEEIRKLRGEGFVGGILAVFGRHASHEDAVARVYEAGADEFVRLPLAESIIRIRIQALLTRIETLQELKAAHDRLRELFHFIHHDLATPLSTLQLSIAALERIEDHSERAKELISRSSRAIMKMTETLNLTASDERSSRT